jgi:choice-of-anchor A domain-containing protein
MRKKLGVLVGLSGILGVGALGVSTARAATVDLGAAAQYAVFSLTGTPVTISGPSGVTGNVAVGPQGSLQMSGSTFVTGTVTLNQDGTPADNATLGLSGSAHTGTVLHADLTAAVSDITARSSFYAGLTATQNLGALNLSASATQTIVGNGGLNVIDISSLMLSGSSVLTLEGGANDAFIIDDPGGFTMSGSTKIDVSGGLLISNVLFNDTGSGAGAQTVNLAGSFVDGNVLAVGREIQVGPGIVDGSVIGGGDMISIHSGGQVFGTAAVPLPAAVWPGTAMLVALGVARVLRARLSTVA